VAWEPCGFVDALVDAGYCVVTYAARGVAPSDAPRPPYTVEEMTRDLAVLIERFELQPCSVIGYSLGGFQAELLARTRPELVRAIVLLASAGPLSTLLDTVHDAGTELLERLGSIPQSFLVFEGLVGELAPDVLRNDAEQVALWRALLGAQSDVWTAPEGERGQWHAGAAWTRDPHRMEALTTITAPVLVAAYEHDLKFPPDGARLAASLIPNGEFVEIAGAAHGGAMTHTRQTLDVVLAFLAASAARRTDLRRST
jgi:pimeloyl-ACP methyl ester carboxylesterase